ncbi:hypothetical protein BJY00DRAFT_161131 [Aspergillus carlsbadensis]|nr:hypothetical protein BJY00DRAFT_161131 [Aspergillus carlsbadensis]
MTSGGFNLEDFFDQVTEGLDDYDNTATATSVENGPSAIEGGENNPDAGGASTATEFPTGSSWDDSDETLATVTAGTAASTVETDYTTPTTFTSQTTPTTITSDSTNHTLSDSDNDDGGGGGISNSTKIAIAVPVAIVGAAIIAAILFFLLRRRRRQRNLESQPVISARQMDNSSSVFLPQQQPQIQPVPLPVAAPITRRPVPEGPYVEPVEPASAETNIVAAGAARDLEWRTSEERGGRPRSPFDHPRDNDDNLSIVSGISVREAMMRARGPRDDDMSSVSSFEDEPRPSTTNRGG